MNQLHSHCHLPLLHMLRPRCMRWASTCSDGRIRRPECIRVVPLLSLVLFRQILFQPVYLLSRLPARSSAFLRVRMHVRLFVCLSVCLSICLSICEPVCPSFYLLAFLLEVNTIFLPLCMPSSPTYIPGPACMRICMYICLCLSA